MNKDSFFRDDNGKKSAGRLLSFLGIIVGILMVATAVGLSIFTVLNAQVLGVQLVSAILGGMTTLAGLGTAIITGAHGFKVLQKQSEARMFQPNPIGNPASVQTAVESNRASIVGSGVGISEGEGR